uniref:Uncharacterized protein n=1 Tax=Glossina austeni TaxID=7395 RepID=A0A1A9VBE8_GLOAU
MLIGCFSRSSCGDADEEEDDEADVCKDDVEPFNVYGARNIAVSTTSTAVTVTTNTAADTTCIVPFWFCGWRRGYWRRKRKREPSTPTTVAMQVEVTLRGSKASSFIPILKSLTGGLPACLKQAAGAAALPVSCNLLKRKKTFVFKGKFRHRVMRKTVFQGHTQPHLLRFLAPLQETEADFQSAASLTCPLFFAFHYNLSSLLALTSTSTADNMKGKYFNKLSRKTRYMMTMRGKLIKMIYSPATLIHVCGIAVTIRKQYLPQFPFTPIISSKRLQCLRQNNIRVQPAVN